MIMLNGIQHTEKTEMTIKTGDNCVSWERQQSRQQNAKTQSAVIKLLIICLEI